MADWTIWGCWRGGTLQRCGGRAGPFNTQTNYPPDLSPSREHRVPCQVVAPHHHHPQVKKKNHQDFVCLVTVDIFLNHRLLSQGAFMEGKSKICASSLWMEVRLKLCATTHIYGDRPYCDVRKGRWNAHRSLVIFFSSSGDLKVK